MEHHQQEQSDRRYLAEYESYLVENLHSRALDDKTVDLYLKEIAQLETKEDFDNWSAKMGVKNFPFK